MEKVSAKMVDVQNAMGAFRWSIKHRLKELQKIS